MRFGILLGVLLTAAGSAWAEAPRLGVVDYATILLYLALLVGMGAYFSRREKSTEAFFLGGRRIPWWAVGLSIFGTSLSAITYLSIPAKAYATNWVFAVANVGILFVAPLVTRYYLPPFREAPITTAYEYLEQRFNLLVRIYGSICFFIYQIGRVGIVLLLPAIALNATTGMDVNLCILAMGVLATAYTVLGGIEAVIWTDVMQALVLVAGAVIALVLVALKVEGGLAAGFQMAQEAGKLQAISGDWGWTAPALWVVLLGTFFSSFYPATADQTIVQRYLSTADAKAAGRAVWTNALLTIPITFLFFGLGTALWVYFQQHPEHLNPDLKNDAILPLFVVLAFPAGLKGILIAGVFAAAMSSLDSSINSVASVLVNDYYKRFVPSVAEHNALWAARIITVVFGLSGTLAALYAARNNDPTLWDSLLKLLSFVGGGLSGVFALGVFTRQANGIGACIGAAASAAAVYGLQKTDVHFLLQAPAAFLTAFIVGYVASQIADDYRAQW